MKSKSWKLLPPTRELRNFCFVLTGLLGFTGLPAQEPPAPPIKPKPGFVRVWNMFPQSDATLELMNTASPSTPLLIAPPKNSLAPYVSVTAGKLQLSLFRVGKRDTAVRTFVVDVRPEQFITMLVAPPVSAGSPAAFTLIEEGGTRTSGPGSLTVRFHTEQVSRATVTVTGSKSSVIVDKGTNTATINDLPGGTPEIQATFVLSDGKSFVWRGEASFTQSKRATLLITEDRSGRLRPRISMDAYYELTESEKEAAAKEASASPSPSR